MTGARAVPAPRHIPALDGVRALSVISVILFHYGLLIGPLPGAPHWLHKFGALSLGVQMFFILSGALITSLLVNEYERSRTVTLKSFYVRRSRRLGPALVILIPVMIVCQVVWHGALVSPLGPHPWVTVLTVALFVGNWTQFHREGDLGWLGPAWSLGVEEQFYLTWPILLRFSLARQVRRGRVFVGFFLALVVSVGLAALAMRRYGGGSTYYFTPTQLPCIICGSALGYELTTNPRGRLAGWLRVPAAGLVGIIGVLVVGYAITRPDHYRFLYRGGYVPFALFGCLLVGHCFAAADRQSWVTRALAWRPLEAVGRVSYEAYLVHCIVILAVIHVAPHLQVYAMLALDTLLVGGASAAMYLLFDSPIRRNGWRWLLRRSARDRSSASPTI